LDNYFNKKRKIFWRDLTILFVALFIWFIVGIRSLDKTGSDTSSTVIFWLIIIAFIALKIYRRNQRHNIPCGICGNSKTHTEVFSGRLCDNCKSYYVKYFPNFTLKFKNLKIDELSKFKKQNDLNLVMHEKFKSTKKIGNSIEFDQYAEEFRVIYKPGVYSSIYKYKDVIEFELLEDGITTVSGGLDGAVVGGVLFGGAGAIVGSNVANKTARKQIENIKIKLILNDFNCPTIYIEMWNNKPLNTSSLKYKNIKEEAQEIISSFTVLKANKETNLKIEQTTQTQQIYSSIRELKSLLEDGIITEEDFNKKKKEILGV
jgi:hypothetical protein